MNTKDWMQNAAIEIDEMGSSDESAGWVRDVIAKHCPINEPKSGWQDGVAYMPVPRCETCAHFKSARRLRLTSNCMILNIPVEFDFGCTQWKEK